MTRSRQVFEGAKENIFEIGYKLEVMTHGVPRYAQYLALALLPIIIIVNLAVLVAIRQILEGLMIQDLTGGDLSVFSFFITGMMLCLFIVSVWSWFYWVRTGGFKLFD